MNPTEGGLAFAGQLFESGCHRLSIFAEDNEFLGGIAPPAIRVGKVSNEIGSGILQHIRLGARFVILVYETIDATLADVFVDAPFINHTAKIASLASPVSLLDNAPMHINEEHGSVWCCFRAQRSEVDVFRTHELDTGICITEHGQPVLTVDFRSADQTAHGLGNE